MDMEQQKRKPIAIPILIILLVVSFTMNVLLSTKNIQHGREQLEQTGADIIQSALTSKEHVGRLLTFVDRIRDDSNEEIASQRALAYAAAVHMEAEDALVRLQQYAEDTPLTEMRVADAATNMTEFQQKTIEQLTIIGQGKDAFTATELEQLEQLHTTLQQINKEWDAFPFQYAGYSSSMIRVANGQEWLPVADQLNKIVTGNTE